MAPLMVALLPVDAVAVAVVDMLHMCCAAQGVVTGFHVGDMRFAAFDPTAALGWLKNHWKCVGKVYDFEEFGAFGK